MYVVHLCNDNHLYLYFMFAGGPCLSSVMVMMQIGWCATRLCVLGSTCIPSTFGPLQTYTTGNGLWNTQRILAESCWTPHLRYVLLIFTINEINKVSVRGCLVIGCCALQYQKLKTRETYAGLLKKWSTPLQKIVSADISVVSLISLFTPCLDVWLYANNMCLTIFGLITEWWGRILRIWK